MFVGTTQNLLTDVKRLLESAKEDYENKCLDTHDYYVSELNLLLNRARDLAPNIEIPNIKEAESDEVVHTSWVSGTPYNPDIIPSYGSKTKKLREVINVADKLAQEISSLAEFELAKNSKKARA